MKNKGAQWLFFLWLLAWPWSTKLILRPAETNYLEIAWYLSSFLLIWPITKFICRVLQNSQKTKNLNQLRPSWWWGAILLFIISVTSVLWAIDSSLAFYRLLILSGGLALFFLATDEKITQKGSALKVFLLGLIPPALLGLWQFWSQNAIANKYLGLAAHTASELGVAVIETGAGRFLRSYGSFDHPNIFGSIMALGALITLYLVLREKFSKREQVLALVVFLILVAGMISSFSRAAVFAFVISLGALFLTQQKIFWPKVGSFVMGLVVLVTLALLTYQPLLVARTDLAARLEAKSVNERVSYFWQSGEIISSHPVRGVGLGGYIVGLMLNENGFPAWYYQPVHNYWLLVWAELGIFGLLAILLLWFGVLEESLKNKSWPIWLFLFLVSMLDHWMWTQSSALLIIFFVLGSLRQKD